ncbi:hypothetical protein JG688_00018414 [Phytophthora aleatoria]|uniref:BED-type domain-containing protein n=1 Tax=Phytophthora aleatoria TaxID=2496075 RepID=A0A8J5LXQ3_9STRA|nr:hypothetical protein JG688_00018414 [Phytophthora aleatoria]
MDYFRCRCSKIRKQDSKTGYTNLISHIRAQHPNFAAEIASSGHASGTLIGFVDKKSQTIYSWIDWIVSYNLLFSFLGNQTVAKYAAVQTISPETAEEYMALLTKTTLPALFPRNSALYGMAAPSARSTTWQFLGCSATTAR